MSCQHCEDVFVTESELDGCHNKPKMLACMHILCSRCLADQIRTIPDQQIVVVVCPFCSEPTIKELPGEVSGHLENISRSSSYDSDISLTGIDTTPIDFQPHRSVLRHEVDNSFDGSDIFPLPLSDFDVQNQSFEAPTFEDIYQQQDYINDSTELDQDSIQSDTLHLEATEHPHIEHAHLQTTEFESFAHWTLIAVDLIILVYISLSLFGGLEALADRGMVQIYASVDIQNMLYVFLLSHMFLQELPNSSLSQSYDIVDTHTSNRDVHGTSDRHVSDSVAALLVVLDMCAICAMFVSCTNETLTTLLHVAIQEIHTMIRTGSVSVFGVAIVWVVSSVILSLVLAVLMYVQSSTLHETDGTVYTPNTPLRTPRQSPYKSHDKHANSIDENTRNMLRRHGWSRPHTTPPHATNTAHTNTNDTSNSMNYEDVPTTHNPMRSTRTDDDSVHYDNIYPPSPTTHYINPAAAYSIHTTPVHTTLPTTPNTTTSVPSLYDEYNGITHTRSDDWTEETVQHTKPTEVVLATTPRGLSAVQDVGTGANGRTTLNTQTPLPNVLPLDVDLPPLQQHVREVEAEPVTVEEPSHVYNTPVHATSKGCSTGSDNGNNPLPNYEALNTAPPNYGNNYIGGDDAMSAEVKVDGNSSVGEGLPTVGYNEHDNNYPVYTYAGIESKTKDQDDSVVVVADGNHETTSTNTNSDSGSNVHIPRATHNIPTSHTNMNTSVAYSPLQPLAMADFTLPLTPLPLTPLPLTQLPLVPPPSHVSPITPLLLMPLSPVQIPLSPLPLPIAVASAVAPIAPQNDEVLVTADTASDHTSTADTMVHNTTHTTHTTPTIDTNTTEHTAATRSPPHTCTPPSPPTTLPIATLPSVPSQPALPLTLPSTSVRSKRKKGTKGWKGRYNQHSTTTLPTATALPTMVPATTVPSTTLPNTLPSSPPNALHNTPSSVQSSDNAASSRAVTDTTTNSVDNSGVNNVVHGSSEVPLRSTHNKAQDSPQSVRAIRKAALKSANSSMNNSMHSMGSVNSVLSVGSSGASQSNNSSGSSIHQTKPTTTVPTNTDAPISSSADNKIHSVHVSSPEAPTYSQLYEQRVRSRSNSGSVGSGIGHSHSVGASNNSSHKNSFVADTESTTLSATVPTITDTHTNTSANMNDSGIVSPDKLSEWMRARSVSESEEHNSNSCNNIDSSGVVYGMSNSTSGVEDGASGGDVVTNAHLMNSIATIDPADTERPTIHSTVHTTVQPNTTTITLPTTHNYDSDSDHSYNSDSTYNSTSAVSVRVHKRGVLHTPHSLHSLHVQQVYPEPVDNVVSANDSVISGEVVGVSGVEVSVLDVSINTLAYSSMFQGSASATNTSMHDTSVNNTVVVNSSVYADLLSPTIVNMYDGTANGDTHTDSVLDSDSAVDGSAHVQQVDLLADMEGTVNNTGATNLPTNNTTDTTTTTIATATSNNDVLHTTSTTTAGSSVCDTNTDSTVFAALLDLVDTIATATSDSNVITAANINDTTTTTATDATNGSKHVVYSTFITATEVDDTPDGSIDTANVSLPYADTINTTETTNTDINDPTNTVSAVDSVVNVVLSEVVRSVAQSATTIVDSVHITDDYFNAIVSVGVVDERMDGRDATIDSSGVVDAVIPAAVSSTCSERNIPIAINTDTNTTVTNDTTTPPNVPLQPALPHTLSVVPLIPSPRKTVAISAIAQKYMDRISGVSSSGVDDNSVSSVDVSVSVVADESVPAVFDVVGSADSTVAKTDTNISNTNTTTNTTTATPTPAPTTRTLHNRAYSMATTLLLSAADSIDTMFDTLQHDVDVINHTIHEHDDIHIVHGVSSVSVVRSGSGDGAERRVYNASGVSNDVGNVSSVDSTGTSAGMDNVSDNTIPPTSSHGADDVFMHPDLSSAGPLPPSNIADNNSSRTSPAEDSGIVHEMDVMVGEMVECVHATHSLPTTHTMHTSVDEGTSPLCIDTVDATTTPMYTQTTAPDPHSPATPNSNSTHALQATQTILSPIHPIHPSHSINPTSPEGGLDLSRIYPANDEFCMDREEVCSANEVFTTYSDARSVVGSSGNGDNSAGSNGVSGEKSGTADIPPATTTTGGNSSNIGHETNPLSRKPINTTSTVTTNSTNTVYSPYNYTSDNGFSPVHANAVTTSTGTCTSTNTTTPGTSNNIIPHSTTTTTPNTATRSRSTIRASIKERMHARLNNLPSPGTGVNSMHIQYPTTTTAANTTSTYTNTTNTTMLPHTTIPNTTPPLNTPDDVDRFENEMHTMYNMYVQTNSTYNINSAYGTANSSQPNSGTNIGRNTSPRPLSTGLNNHATPAFSPVVRKEMVNSATSPMKFSHNTNTTNTVNTTNTANTSTNTSNPIHNLHSIDAYEGDYIPTQTVNPALLHYHSTQQVYQQYTHLATLDHTTNNSKEHRHTGVSAAIVAEMVNEVSTSPPSKLNADVVHHNVHNTYSGGSVHGAHSINSAHNVHNIHGVAGSAGSGGSTSSNSGYNSSNATYPHSAMSSAYSSAYSMYDHNSSLYDVYNRMNRNITSPHTVDTTAVRAPTPVYTSNSTRTSPGTATTAHTTAHANSALPTHHEHPKHNTNPKHNVTHTHTNSTSNTYTTHPNTTHPHLALHPAHSAHSSEQRGVNVTASSGMVRSNRHSPVPTTPIRKHASMNSNTINTALSASRNANIRNTRPTPNTNPTNNTTNNTANSSSMHTPALTHSSSVSSIQSNRSRGGTSLDSVSDAMDSNSSYVMVVHMNPALTTHRCIGKISKCITAVVTKCQLRGVPVVVLVAPPIGSAQGGGGSVLGGSGGYTYLYAVPNSRGSGGTGSCASGSSGSSDVEYIVKVRSKPSYLVPPADTPTTSTTTTNTSGGISLTERMFRNALTALVSLDSSSRTTLHTTHNIHSNTTHTIHSSSMSSVYNQEDPRALFEAHLNSLRLEIKSALGVFTATSDVVVVCDGACWPFHCPTHLSAQSGAFSQWLVYRSSVPYLQLHFVAINALVGGSTSGNVSVSSK